jgi:hypothetical protein
MVNHLVPMWSSLTMKSITISAPRMDMTLSGTIEAWAGTPHVMSVAGKIAGSIVAQSAISKRVGIVRSIVFEDDVMAPGDCGLSL